MRPKRPLRVASFFSLIAGAVAFCASFIHMGVPPRTVVLVACLAIAIGGGGQVLRGTIAPPRRRPLEEAHFPTRTLLAGAAAYLGVMGYFYWRYSSALMMGYIAASLVATEACAVGEWLWNRRLATGREGDSSSTPRPNHREQA